MVASEHNYFGGINDFVSNWPLCRCLWFTIYPNSLYVSGQISESFMLLVALQELLFCFMGVNLGQCSDSQTVVFVRIAWGMCQNADSRALYTNLVYLCGDPGTGTFHTYPGWFWYWRLAHNISLTPKLMTVPDEEELLGLFLYSLISWNLLYHFKLWLILFPYDKNLLFVKCLEVVSLNGL